MSFHQGSQADFLAEAKTLIENAIALPEIAAALGQYGYDAARLAEGRALWAQADAAMKKQSLDSGSRSGAVAEHEKAWEKANAAYMKALKVARVAFGDDAKAITALMLYGPRKQSLSGWLEQAETFYANLAAESSLAMSLERYGYTSRKIGEERALVAAVRESGFAKVQGAGAAQSSTAARDEKLRELDSWVSELRTIARVAFYEEPQELEKLGLLALNGPRRVKKLEASPAPLASPSAAPASSAAAKV